MRPPFYSMKDGDSLKMRYRAALAAAIMTIVIPGCSTNNADTSCVSGSESISSASATYFESNERVDKFFSDYNSFAEITITSDMIERGNIRTKANVYIDTISITIMDVDGCISIRFDAKPEDDAYSFFRDFVLVLNPSLDKSEIFNAWESKESLDKVEVSISKTENNTWFELKEV